MQKKIIKVIFFIFISLFCLMKTKAYKNAYLSYNEPNINHDDIQIFLNNSFKKNTEKIITNKLINKEIKRNDFQDKNSNEKSTISFKNDQGKKNNDEINNIDMSLKSITTESKLVKNNFNEVDKSSTNIVKNNKIENKNKDLITDKQKINNNEKKLENANINVSLKGYKIIDVSSHQGIINWNEFKHKSNCYGVILRIGFWNIEDKFFKKNISEIKKHNIPYGIYLFSYAKNKNEAILESNFTYKIINKYKLEPKLGIFYDIESWKTKKYNSNFITTKKYDEIILNYIFNLNKKTNSNFEIGIYTGRWYAYNRIGVKSRKFIKWVAEYNNKCKYAGDYKYWQFTSKGRVPGIKGNVDISYIIK